MDNSKRKVVLEFPDLKALVDYSLLVEVSNCEVNRSKHILICELSEADVELATNGYRAIILE